MVSSTHLSMVIMYFLLENIYEGKRQWNYLLYIFLKGDTGNPEPVLAGGHQLQESILLQVFLQRVLPSEFQV